MLLLFDQPVNLVKRYNTCPDLVCLSLGHMPLNTVYIYPLCRLDQLGETERQREREN